MEKISKEEFLKVYNKHKLNKFISFINKYFSTTIIKKPIPWGSWVSFISFFIASFGMVIFDILENKEISNLFTLFYIPFVLWAIITLVAFIMKNNRNKKISKELDITIDDYNNYVNLYL